ncbi:MAG: pyridoxamine 5'-phosphate oxidase [Phycisphaerales bacterium]|nr:pyridoxamine 5'-phosphate oxidase [Phycisphaerales bacterium]
MDFEHPPTDPVSACEQWFAEAGEQSGLPNPNAMALSTVSADGRPSIRMILLKGFDARGAVFYTNSESRKGIDLAACPRAALLFHWDSMERQIRIEGAVTRVSDEEADAYFASRRRESRIGAWASAQSRPCASREELDAAYDEQAKRFEGGDVPRPPHWFGYRIALEHIEFWQGGDARLHDRVVYDRGDGGSWTIQRQWP